MFLTCPDADVRAVLLASASGHLPMIFRVENSASDPPGKSSPIAVLPSIPADEYKNDYCNSSASRQL
jgi:hypothetical protein